MTEFPPRTALADLQPALALGPLDGRYRKDVAPLVDHLSEAALNRERMHVEVEWLIFLSENEVVPGARRLLEDEKAQLRELVSGFDEETIAQLAEFEAVTVHDVKAVEYAVKAGLGRIGGDDVSELVHFACTSEDINNTSYALMVKGAVEQVWLPAARRLVEQLRDLAAEHRDQPMLSHTHGQPATPTTLGKEIGVFAHRLGRQLRRIERTEYLGKINGATGTFSAHATAVPGADWPALAKAFVEHLGLTYNPLTTQIESHDWQAELYADIARFNRILHNLATDVWTYISMNYFIQIPVEGATGSSTMPHKINPIRFENAEANLEISSALFDTLASTLVTSRLQRDLTDSSSQRNIGPAFGHSLLAISNVSRGLSRLAVNAEALDADLEGNWEVLGEAVQSVMRAAGAAGVPGMDNPYEKLKELTRGKRVDAEGLREFVRGLGLPAEAEARLLELTPQSYTGLASRVVGETLGLD
ncbi:adenylosuccinate lyase [Sediminivirga luteola]|uniref:Adenylosuccinate lyase n=1 Tax=Sediminivirga luteola TaxID=1774748 RepID=A0A8J2U0Z1_9MICO|nr:adenylosuccinate lyase [Sediminivirga luteola]MCI2264534.1 adenylosuccinate lyase [Sediminivirga luteola]GGA25906.1 adenylosuccinate lyase [Sediminivirga luteola]